MGGLWGGFFRGSELTFQRSLNLNLKCPPSASGPLPETPSTGQIELPGEKKKGQKAQNRSTKKLKMGNAQKRVFGASPS